MEEEDSINESSGNLDGDTSLSFTPNSRRKRPKLKTKFKSLDRSSRMLNASLNSSVLKQTLKTNNRALAKELEKVRKELVASQQQILQLENEKQEMHLELLTLQRVAGLKNDQIEEEVNLRMQDRLKEIRSMFNKLSTNLLTTVDVVHEGMSLCSSSGGRASSLGVNTTRGSSLGITSRVSSLTGDHPRPQRTIYQMAAQPVIPVVPVEAVPDDPAAAEPETLEEIVADVVEEVLELDAAVSKAPPISSKMDLSCIMERSHINFDDLPFTEDTEKLPEKIMELDEVNVPETEKDRSRERRRRCSDLHKVSTTQAELLAEPETDVQIQRRSTATRSRSRSRQRTIDVPQISVQKASESESDCDPETAATSSVGAKARSRGRRRTRQSHQQWTATGSSPVTKSPGPVASSGDATPKVDQASPAKVFKPMSEIARTPPVGDLPTADTKKVNVEQSSINDIKKIMLREVNVDSDIENPDKVFKPRAEIPRSPPVSHSNPTSRRESLAEELAHHQVEQAIRRSLPLSGSKDEPIKNNVPKWISLENDDDKTKRLSKKRKSGSRVNLGKNKDVNNSNENSATVTKDRSVNLKKGKQVREPKNLKHVRDDLKNKQNVDITDVLEDIDDNVDSIPDSQESRRGTFVVTKKALNRRGTFVLSPKKHATKNNEGQPKSSQLPSGVEDVPDDIFNESASILVNSENENVDGITEDTTVFMNEDMDFTEVVPMSQLLGARPTPEYTTTQESVNMLPSNELRPSPKIQVPDRIKRGSCEPSFLSCAVNDEEELPHPPRVTARVPSPPAEVNDVLISDDEVETLVQDTQVQHAKSSDADRVETKCQQSESEIPHSDSDQDDLLLKKSKKVKKSRSKKRTDKVKTGRSKSKVSKNSEESESKTDDEALGEKQGVETTEGSEAESEKSTGRVRSKRRAKQAVKSYAEQSFQDESMVAPVQDPPSEKEDVENEEKTKKKFNTFIAKPGKITFKAGRNELSEIMAGKTKYHSLLPKEKLKSKARSKPRMVDPDFKVPLPVRDPSQPKSVFDISLNESVNIMPCQTDFSSFRANAGDLEACRQQAKEKETLEVPAINTDQTEEEMVNSPHGIMLSLANGKRTKPRSKNKKVTYAKKLSEIHLTTPSPQKPPLTADAELDNLTTPEQYVEVKREVRVRDAGSTPPRMSLDPTDLDPAVEVVSIPDTPNVLANKERKRVHTDSECSSTPPKKRSSLDGTAPGTEQATDVSEQSLTNTSEAASNTMESNKTSSSSKSQSQSSTIETKHLKPASKKHSKLSLHKHGQKDKNKEQGLTKMQLLRKKQETEARLKQSKPVVPAAPVHESEEGDHIKLIGSDHPQEHSTATTPTAIQSPSSAEQLTSLEETSSIPSPHQELQKSMQKKVTKIPSPVTFSGKPPTVCLKASTAPSKDSVDESKLKKNVKKQSVSKKGDQSKEKKKKTKEKTGIKAKSQVDKAKSSVCVENVETDGVKEIKNTQEVNSADKLTNPECGDELQTGAEKENAEATKGKEKKSKIARLSLTLLHPPNDADHENQSHSEEEAGRRSRRGGSAVSYKEVSLNKKLRQGDPISTTIYTGTAKDSTDGKRGGKKSVGRKKSSHVATDKRSSMLSDENV